MQRAGIEPAGQGCLGRLFDHCLLSESPACLLHAAAAYCPPLQPEPGRGDGLFALWVGHRTVAHQTRGFRPLTVRCFKSLEPIADVQTIPFGLLV